MSKNLWCIRHGTALHNILGKQIGDIAYTNYTDTPLVKKGGSNCFSYSYSTLRINKNERKRK